MIWLVLGLLMWTGAHFFKRLFPMQRAAMGKAGRGVVAVLVIVGIVLMVVGYRAADFTYLYDLPFWVRHVNNLLMLIALFLMDAGRVNGIVRTKVRHPMLTGVVVWAVAHLLVNGDLTSFLLFGGLGLWALAEMAVLNRAEGPWSPPAHGTIAKDLRVMAIALVLYALIVGIHYWLLGYWVVAVLNG